MRAMLSLEPRHERCNIGARPFLERRRGFADIDETGDALSWPETDPLANVGMVGAPFRNPVRDIAHGMRGQHESLAAGARRKNLLPFGNGNGFAHAAHDPDDHRGSTEVFALGAQAFFADIRIVFAKALSQNLAHAGPRVAFEYQEPPWHELAVIGHSRGSLNNCVEFRSVGSRAGHRL